MESNRHLKPLSMRCLITLQNIVITLTLTGNQAVRVGASDPRDAIAHFLRSSEPYSDTACQEEGHLNSDEESIDIEDVIRGHAIDALLADAINFVVSKGGAADPIAAMAARIESAIGNAPKGLQFP